MDSLQMQRSPLVSSLVLWKKARKFVEFRYIACKCVIIVSGICSRFARPFPGVSKRMGSGDETK